MDVLKERISPTLASDPNQGHSDKPTVKKIRKEEIEKLKFEFYELISRSLRNRKKDHLSSISMIEVNDHCSNEEINDFLAQEDLDNQCLNNDIVGQVVV
jgi:hypothetical protein